MLEYVVKQEILFWVMAFLLGIGTMAKLVSAITTRKMVRAAGDIHKSNHRLMKLIKAKFEHACMISDKVQNVEAFVDKYIYEYRVCGMRIHTWRNMPKKIMWLIGVIGVFGIFESYRIGGKGNLMLDYVQWTSLFLIFLFLISVYNDEEMRIKAAKTYVIDYLENVCMHRYAKQNKSAEQEEEAVEEEPSAEVQNAETEEIEEEISEEQRKSEQELRIRAILEEFLA
jgi:hypothetical protein